MKEEDKIIKCMYCNNPIHIDNFAGFSFKGFVCGNSDCLMKLAQDIEGGKEWEKKKEVF